MKFLFTLITLILFSSEIFAQATEPINTDRPDQSDGTYILPKNNYQSETGLLYGKAGSAYLINNIMIRYGVADKTELRLLIDHGIDDAAYGIMPVGISVKHNLISQKGYRPEITAVGYVRLSFTATEKYRTKNLPASFLLAFQNDLSGKFSVGYNAGVLTDGEGSFNELATASFGYILSERISVFTEYFSQFARQSKPEHNIDLGMLFLVKKTLQVDLALGSSLLRADKNQFLTTGISYRFKK